jgi:hypothetical protein
MTAKISPMASKFVKFVFLIFETLYIENDRFWEKNAKMWFFIVAS